MAAVFLWAAYAKIMLATGGPTMYEYWIDAYPTLRYALPGMEAALAVLIILGIWPRLTAVTTVVLVSAFSGLLILEMFKEHPKPCGCMGAVAALYEPSAIRMGLLMNLGRNLLLMGGAYYIALRSGRVGKSGPAKAVPGELAPAASGSVT